MPKNRKRNHKVDIGDMFQRIVSDPPDFMDVRDEQWSIALMSDMERNTIEEIIEFMIADKIEGNKEAWGPPKFCYSDDYFDCFDFYAAFGCPNCGKDISLKRHSDFCLYPAVLLCKSCSHEICQLHRGNESDNLVDDRDDEKERDSIYVGGVRRQYRFNDRKWWHNNYLPLFLRQDDIETHIKMINHMANRRAATTNEICEVCGNDKAYYTTYQARSADEGMTIMYECTRCYARKTFNN